MARVSTPQRPAESVKDRAAAPVFKVRHRAIHAAVWKNPAGDAVMFNTTVSRSYKDGETWKESGSFGFDDLLIVAELLRTCYGFISRETAKLSRDAAE